MSEASYLDYCLEEDSDVELPESDASSTASVGPPMGTQHMTARRRVPTASHPDYCTEVDSDAEGPEGRPPWCVQAPQASSSDYCMQEYSDAEMPESDASTASGLPMDAQRTSSCHQVPRDRTTSVVTVKNTFIDGWAEEDEETGMAELLWVGTAKSCPVPKSRSFDDGEDEDGEELGRQSRLAACLLGCVPRETGATAHRLATVQYLPCHSPDAPPDRVWPQQLEATCLDDDARVASSLLSLAKPQEPEQEKQPAWVVGFAQTPTPPIAAAGPAPAMVAGCGSGRRSEVVVAHVTPWQRRCPETSLGSELHVVGDCKPCAFFWRPQGCTNGKDCRHCHLCEQGEAKARRKCQAVVQRRQRSATERVA